MKLLVDSGIYAVAKLPTTEPINIGHFKGTFYSITQSSEELSLVCEEGLLPDTAKDVKADWKMLKVDGVLDFSLVGIIAKISAILAQEKISIFVISTFNTDYVLVQNSDMKAACQALKEHEYEIIG